MLHKAIVADFPAGIRSKNVFAATNFRLRQPCASLLGRHGCRLGKFLIVVNLHGGVKTPPYLLAEAFLENATAAVRGCFPL